MHDSFCGYPGPWKRISANETSALPADGHADSQAVGKPSGLHNAAQPALSSDISVQLHSSKELLLRLVGQQAFCGPFRLTTPLSRLQDVQIRLKRSTGEPQAPLQTQLAVEIVPDRHGGCSICAHSGLQVGQLDMFMKL